MFCPECGTKNPEENSFCCLCNSPLIDNSPKVMTSEQSNAVFPGNTPNQSYQPRQYAISIDFGAATERLKNFDAKKAADNVRNRTNKMKKSTKAILISVFAVFIAIAAVASVGSFLFSPERVAKEYFKSYIEGDYRAMFSYMQIDDSPFMTADKFEDYMLNSEEGFNRKLVDYSIYESYHYYDDEYLFESGEFNKSYDISYMLQGDINSNSYTVNLVLIDSHKFVFFKEYKVIASQYIVDNYDVLAIKNSTVRIDGVELEEQADNLFADGDYGYESYEVYSTYTIDSIFGFEHTLEIENDYFETYNETVYLYSDSSDVYYSTDMKTETETALVQKSEAVFSYLVESAIAGEYFPESSENWQIDYDYYDDLQGTYEYLLSEFSKDSISGYTTMNVSTFEFEESEFEDGVYVITTSFSYSGIYNSYDWWTSGYTESQESGTGTLTIAFTNVDGEWIVNDFYYSGI